jgi:hypothetical protein
MYHRDFREVQIPTRLGLRTNLRTESGMGLSPGAAAR